MEGSVKELANYRLERAAEMLQASKDNLEMKQYRTSLNRSYYAVFHAMRAVNITEGYDSSKHSGVISFFTQTFLKTERIDRSMAKIIKEASYLREKSDYDDFYIASKDEAEKQIGNAELFLQKICEFMADSDSVISK